MFIETERTPNPATLMFRPGITDSRHFYDGDVRFALPFGTEV